MISKSIQLITSIIFIGVGIIAGTYAIYKVTNYGIGNLETAKWSIKVKANETELDTNTQSNIISLSNITWFNELGNVADGKIAPGSYTTFNIEIDATGTETDVDYKVEIGDLSSLPSFTISPGNNNVPKEGTIYFSETNSMKLVIPITIIWNGNINDDNSKNIKDLSFKNQTLDIPIIVTTSQKLP